MDLKIGFAPSQSQGEGKHRGSEEFQSHDAHHIGKGKFRMLPVPEASRHAFVNSRILIGDLKGRARDSRLRCRAHPELERSADYTSGLDSGGRFDAKQQYSPRAGGKQMIDRPRLSREGFENTTS